MTTEITSTDQAIEILQPVMDAAFQTIGTDFFESINALPNKIRVVVHIGKLYQQVTNGGFMQWLGNGYDDKFVVSALRQVNTPTSLKALSLVHNAMSAAPDKSIRCEDEDDFEFINKFFDKLDDKFYELDDQLLCDLAIWYQSENAA